MSSNCTKIVKSFLKVKNYFHKQLLNLLFLNRFFFLLQDPLKLEVKLIKELLVIKIKPGLSSYANDPDKVGIINAIIVLINN